MKEREQNEILKKLQKNITQKKKKQKKEKAKRGRSIYEVPS